MSSLIIPEEQFRKLLVRFPYVTPERIKALEASPVGRRYLGASAAEVLSEPDLVLRATVLMLTILGVARSTRLPNRVRWAAAAGSPRSEIAAFCTPEQMASFRMLRNLQGIPELSPFIFVDGQLWHDTRPVDHPASAEFVQWFLKSLKDERQARLTLQVFSDAISQSEPLTELSRKCLYNVSPAFDGLPEHELEARRAADADALSFRGTIQENRVALVRYLFRHGLVQVTGRTHEVLTELEFFKWLVDAKYLDAMPGEAPVAASAPAAEPTPQPPAGPEVIEATLVIPERFVTEYRYTSTFERNHSFNLQLPRADYERLDGLVADEDETGIAEFIEEQRQLGGVIASRTYDDEPYDSEHEMVDTTQSDGLEYDDAELTSRDS